MFLFSDPLLVRFVTFGAISCGCKFSYYLKSLDGKTSKDKSMACIKQTAFRPLQALSADTNPSLKFLLKN